MTLIIFLYVCIFIYVLPYAPNFAFLYYLLFSIFSYITVNKILE